MTENITLGFMVVAGLLAFLAALLMRKQIKDERTRHFTIGEKGEEKASGILDENGGMDRLDDTIVGHKNNVKYMAQADHVIKGTKRIVIVETKCWRGKITGDEKSKQWKIDNNGHITYRRNPINQVKRHVTMLSRIHPDVEIVGYVFMVGWCEFTNQVPDNVIMFKKAYRFQHILREASDEESVTQKIEKAWETIVEHHYSPDAKSREKKYMKYVEARAGNTSKPWRILYASSIAFLFLGIVIRIFF